MDALLLALLIVAANALITYFLLKKQEERLYQRQLKFKLLHEKRVEVLENIYRKFNEYINGLNQVIYQADLLIKNKQTVTERDYRKLQNEVSDVWVDVAKYLSDNQLVLSKSMSKDVNHIINLSGVAQPMLFSILKNTNKTDVVNEEDVERAIQVMEFESSDLEVEALRNPQDLLHLVIIQIIGFEKRLESIYRYVADIENS
jgi:hypothetical protein